MEQIIFFVENRITTNAQINIYSHVCEVVELRVWAKDKCNITCDANIVFTCSN